jgi:hypothetical protein
LAESADHRRSLWKNCLADSFPAGTIVFDESMDVPETARRPNARPTNAQWFGWRFKREGEDYWSNPRIYPAALRRLCDAEYRLKIHVYCVHGVRPLRSFSLEPYIYADALFVSGRRVAGRERLVMIGFNPVAFVEGDQSPFIGMVLAQEGLLQERQGRTWFRQSFKFRIPPEQSLKLYVGQADPNDESHFTIDYKTSLGNGVIDGWLQPDDSVKFQVRSGPALTP